MMEKLAINELEASVHVQHVLSAFLLWARDADRLTAIDGCCEENSELMDVWSNQRCL